MSYDLNDLKWALLFLNLGILCPLTKCASVHTFPWVMSVNYVTAAGRIIIIGALFCASLRGFEGVAHFKVLCGPRLQPSPVLCQRM